MSLPLPYPSWLSRPPGSIPRRYQILAAVAFFLLAVGPARPQNDSPERRERLRRLSAEHRWLELGEALDASGGPPLFRGQVAVALARRHEAERILFRILRSGTGFTDRYQAAVALVHLYLQTGQYRRLRSLLLSQDAASSRKPEFRRLRRDLAPFLGLPDQALASSAPGEAGAASLRHNGDLFLPIQINGKSARYFFDTGAGINALSESEARRLGLRIRDGSGTIGTVTGRRRATFRTAVARELRAGSLVLKNVSFGVFPDTQQPWTDLTPGRRGLLGIPVLLAFRSLQWNRNGTVQIGARGVRTASRSTARPNLYFNDDHLMVRVEFGKDQLCGTLDTGAQTTDLFAGFGRRYPTLMDSAGTKSVTRVTGVGGSTRFSSVTLPKVTFRIGGVATDLKPAHVLMTQDGSGGGLGNFGADLLRQASAFTLDFSSMTLELAPAR